MTTPKKLSRIALLSLALISISAQALAEEPFHFAKGELERPTGYREWIYVGAPLTPNDMNDGKAAFPEFHSVYIDPVSWEHWKRTGEFREGTILIKEMIDVAGKQAASGNGYFMGEFIGLEATVKSRTHFPDEPGNWAYFSFTNEDHVTLKERAAPMPVGTCNSCHGALAADDFVFTQHYPVLRGGRSNLVHATGGTSSMLPRTLPTMKSGMEKDAAREPR